MENNQQLLTNYPDVLNFAQLCEILQIGKQTGYNLLHANKIFHRRVGKKYVIPKTGVIEFLHSLEK